MWGRVKPGARRHKGVRGHSAAGRTRPESQKPLGPGERTVGATQHRIHTAPCRAEDRTTGPHIGPCLGCIPRLEPICQLQLPDLSHTPASARLAGGGRDTGWAARQPGCSWAGEGTGSEVGAPWGTQTAWCNGQCWGHPHAGQTTLSITFPWLLSQR